MRPLEAVQAELDQVNTLLAKTPSSDSVALTDLRQRYRELSAEIAESRRGTPPRPLHARV